jgi:hypothetical protein
MLLQHWLIPEDVLESNRTLSWKQCKISTLDLPITKVEQLPHSACTYISFFVSLNTSVLGDVNCSFCDKHLWRSAGLATPSNCCSQFHFDFFTLKVYASVRFVNTLIAQVFHWHWLDRECNILPATDWELIIIMAIGVVNAIQYWGSIRKPTIYTFTNGWLYGCHAAMFPIVIKITVNIPSNRTIYFILL